MKHKYTLTNITKILDEDITLYRIRAAVDFGNVRKGTLGGYVESADNLSHEGLCWIADNAVAYGRSRVSQNGLLKDRAVVKDYVCVHGDGVVGGKALLKESVHVFDHGVVGAKSFLAGAATVSGNARVFCEPEHGFSRFPNMDGLAIITDNARLEEQGRLRKSAVLRQNSLLRGHGILTGKAVADGDIKIDGKVHISDEVHLLGFLTLAGSCTLRGNVVVCGDKKRLKIAGPSLLICRARVYGHGNLYGIKLSGDRIFHATGPNGKEGVL